MREGRKEGESWGKQKRKKRNDDGRKKAEREITTIKINR